MRLGFRCSRARRRRARCTGCGCGWRDQNIRGLFSSTTTLGRGGEVADALIEGCSGYLQSDGYEVYAGASARAALIHVGCFAHARRRLFEALKALPTGVRKSESAAYEGVRRIDELYAIERQIQTLSDEDRTRIRRERAVPQLHSLHEWATRLQRDTMPSGKLGEALGYLTKQWPKLARYVEDGRVAIDTNLAENAIRPFSLGRRYPRFVIMEGLGGRIAQNRYLAASAGGRLH